ncbi:MAG: hypothetical protein A2Z05_01895 [Chloroflexi bacterium RBG_16_60_22]|nr:MAG: hypothetical protein A2Z05_01895 [Chloroflexi bacterium RBG_16_60_22]
MDRKLVDLLQAKFLLTGQPYADIGLNLGISESEVMARIQQLKAENIVRQIGPVFDAGSLGYKTTLAAMKVAEEEMGRAARIIAEHPGISHGYERDHYFNLWVTLAVPARGDLEAELSGLAASIKAESFFALPAVKLFKLRTHFAMGGQGPAEAPDNHHGKIRRREARLSPADRMVINELQQDLPLVPRPFAPMSGQLGMDEGEFLSRCHSLVQRSIMRRFGAAVNHRQAGFTANAMTGWVAPPGKVNAAGKLLSSWQEVSHCYERRTNNLWRHNLFAMIHGRTREACQEIADEVSAKMGLTDCIMLFSTREFKKTRVKYVV